MMLRSCCEKGYLTADIWRSLRLWQSWGIQLHQGHRYARDVVVSACYTFSVVIQPSSPLSSSSSLQSELANRTVFLFCQQDSDGIISGNDFNTGSRRGSSLAGIERYACSRSSKAEIIQCWSSSCTDKQQLRPSSSLTGGNFSTLPRAVRQCPFESVSPHLTTSRSLCLISAVAAAAGTPKLLSSASGAAFPQPEDRGSSSSRAAVAPIRALTWADRHCPTSLLPFVKLMRAEAPIGTYLVGSCLLHLLPLQSTPTCIVKNRRSSSRFRCLLGSFGHIKWSNFFCIIIRSLATLTSRMRCCSYCSPAPGLFHWQQPLGVFRICTAWPCSRSAPSC